ncbi:MAG: hypothetical protein DLM52_07455 [Chthoniobacterales bacterium]|nr:MAG: hypothetical protein DLM52_07455 [Chthoniobacterales bacterium]
MAAADAVKVLVDTSVWIDHLNRADPLLQRLLLAGVVYVANPVLGEIAAGNIPERRRTMLYLHVMQRFTDPAPDDVLGWIDTQAFGGKGLTWVDCLLLVLAQQNRAVIYTRDRVLARHAAQLKVAFTR